MTTRREIFIKELAGAHYDRIQRRDESALTLLSHQDKNVRSAALLEFSNDCPVHLRDVFAQRCQDMVAGDPESVVRMMAVSAIGRLHSGTRNPRISSFLADLIISDTTLKSVRHLAYLTLHEVQFGFSVRGLEKTIEILRTLSLGEDSKRQSEEKL